MVKKKQKQQTVTSGQARYLRGLGHHLSPVAMIGKEGITEKLTGAVEDVLTAHELIKVRVQENCPLARKDAAEELARRTGAACVQVLGRTFLLYRENRDRKTGQKIELPDR